MYPILLYSPHTQPYNIIHALPLVPRAYSTRHEKKNIKCSAKLITHRKEKYDHSDTQQITQIFSCLLHSNHTSKSTLVIIDAMIYNWMCSATFWDPPTFSQSYTQRKPRRKLVKKNKIKIESRDLKWHICTETRFFSCFFGC